MASAASEPFAAIICPLSASSSLFMVSLLHEGRAKVPDIICNLSGSELKVEVMEEKLLCDLTREVCSVLWVLASPGLNSGLPSLEQLGPSNHMDASLRDLEYFASTCLIG
jgi:exportin-5